ncbi:hypothetical protein D3C86_2009570 [compost metagenome]
MLHFLLNRDLIRPAAGNEFEVLAQVLAEVNNRIQIVQLRHVADGEEAVVQEMRVDLGLQLLQLRSLGTNLLLVYGLDQLS